MSCPPLCPLFSIAHPVLLPEFPFPIPPQLPLPYSTASPLVPDLRTYRVHDRPVGPHAMAMFEVNLFTPAQFGAFIAWLVINRGPLSVLVHPNTGDDERDHTQRATWLGERVPLNLGVFRRVKEMGEADEGGKEGADG